MSQTKPQRFRVLVVDDEVANLNALERTLSPAFELVTAQTAKEALDLLTREKFAVVLSDQRMPDMEGTELLARAATIAPETTRVILTAYAETKNFLDAINRAEIYRYVTKPWDNQELVGIVAHAAERHWLLVRNRELVEDLERQVRDRTEALERANKKLSELAMTDPLTHVMNRRAIFERFQQEIDRSRRYEHSLVAVMIDVDHFKAFNDMEGHVLGDEALKKLAQIISANVRKTDLLGRYGGEEFIVLMPETQVKNALEICERLRAAVERTTMQGAKGAAYLTVSIGVAGFPDEGATPKELVQAADQALYEAKESGRNRVVHQGSNESFFVR